MLRAWAVLGLWTVVVWTLSTDTFAATTTSRILGPLLSWLFPDLDRQQFLFVHFLVRKSMHVFIYAVLGWLAVRAVRVTIGMPLAIQALAALGIVVVIASTDEIRQKYSSVRRGSLYDVGIDTGGGSVGIALGAAFGWLRRRGRTPPGPRNGTPHGAP